jgi:hypothetical protein
MGCQASQEAVKPELPTRFNKEIDKDIQLDFMKLGLVHTEMLQLHQYFHKLKLEPDKSLDLQKYLAEFDLDPTPLHIRIFGSIDALPDHKHKIKFAEFVLHVWRFITMTPVEMAYFAFDFYEQQVELRDARTAKYRDAAEVYGCCDVDAKGDRMRLADLKWAMEESFGERFILAIQQKYRWFEHARIALNATQFRENNYSGWENENTADNEGSCSASMSGDRRGGSMNKRSNNLEPGMTKQDFAQHTCDCPALLEPIAALQGLFASEIVDQWFWGHLHERALRAKCSRMYEEVFAKYHRRRLSRLDTQLSIQRLPKISPGSTRGASPATTNRPRVGSADTSKLTARTAADSTPREDSISVSDQGKLADAFKRAPRMGLSTDLDKELASSGRPPRMDTGATCSGGSERVPTLVHVAKGESEAHRRKTVDNSQLTEASDKLAAKAKRSKQRAERYSLTPDFFGPSDELKRQMRRQPSSGLGSRGPAPMAVWNTRQGKEARRQKMHHQ